MRGASLSIFVFLIACWQSHAQKDISAMFTLVKENQSNVSFINKVTEDDSLNIFNYEYLYNGHGVGIADFNNDGLQDIFFSGNMVPSKLFLNRNDFKFEDITKIAGVAGNNTWATGVSIADVNGDKLPDIYVCHSGYYKDSTKLSNQLFINTGSRNGIPVFKDSAKEYGLDLPGTQSTQAAFFDYDLDGDLDMFLLNHSNHTYNPFLNTRKQRSTPNFKFGNRLFRNDSSPAGAKFTDVTLSSDIINNGLNFGLGIIISDINNDGWPDIYATSDYTEQDYYFVNNKNGTFSQSLQNSFAHISKYSMGADIADYNNDGRFDVLTLDMLPEDNHRQKLLKGADEYDQYHLLVDSGYYHQQMRNMLQLNQGMDNNGNVRFSEIGQFAGVSNTDWSWAGLFADLDNDGWKDLLVTNGYLRDFTDLDFLKYTVADAQIEEAKKGNLKFRTLDLVKKMPSNKPLNYLFRNEGNLQFSDVGKKWGFTTNSISNAAAYADLDNDGDLDVIICNNNEPIMLYRNNVGEIKGLHYCRIKLEGEARNFFAYGAKVKLYSGEMVQYLEQYPVRGYQSTVSTTLHFGLGNKSMIDSIIVEWPGGNVSKLENPGVDKEIYIKQSGATKQYKKSDPVRYLFEDVTSNSGLKFVHRENDFIDFKDEVLLPYQFSKMGPAMTKGDINNDGLEDIFVGGAIGQSSQLFLQVTEGRFVLAESQPWIADSSCEDVNAIFFDVNNDGFEDLYVVSGGNEYTDGSPEYGDRLYINDKKGNFYKADLPEMNSSKHAIAAADIDNDGDIDVFIGGSCVPGSFPAAARSYVLRNDSRGNSIQFTDITLSVSKGLMKPGMVAAAIWSDLDKDRYPELLIAGDWMPIMLFKNNKGILEDVSIPSGLDKTDGMWSSVTFTDFDGDGDIDFILGNCGLNNQFRASQKEPMILYEGDFDNNGTIDPIITYYIQGKSYPMASRDELLDQVVPLRKRFVKYRDYADATVETIFSQDQLNVSKKYYCYNLSSSVLVNNGNGSFAVKPLPAEAQFSKVYGLVVRDFNKDGKKDILTGGNFSGNRVQSGQYDASLGALLISQGNGNFKSLSHEQSGLFMNGDVRNMVIVNENKSRPLIIIARNNSELKALQCNE